MSAESASSPGKSKCPQCSATNPADAEFCSLCGMLFAGPKQKAAPPGPAPAAASPEEEPVAEPAPVPQAPPAPAPAPAEDGFTPIPRRREATAEGRGKWVALLVVIILAVSGGTWWKISRPGKTKTSNGEAPHGSESPESAEAPSLSPIPEALLAPVAPTGGAKPSAFFDKSTKTPPIRRTVAVGLGNSLHDMAYTPDGRFLVGAGYGDFKVRLWDGLTGKELQRIAVKRRPESLAVAPTGESVLVADAYGFLTRYPLHPSGRLGWSRRHRTEGLKHIYVAISPNGRLVATGAWKQVAVLDAKSLAVLARVEMPEHQRRLTFSPDGRRLVIGSQTNKFTVWDLATGKGRTYTVPRVGATSDVGSLAWSSDGKLLATGHMNSSITVWDAEKPAPLKTFYVPQSSTRKVAFSPGSEVLATAHQGGNVHLWEPRTARQLAILKGHAKSARLLAFHPSGRRLATCGEDGNLLFWDTGSLPPAAARPATEEELLAWNLANLPEARPFADGLRAVRTNNLKLFKTVFSRATSQRFAKRGWAGALKDLRPYWEKTVGSTPTSQVHVDFEGTGSRGTLHARAGIRRVPPTPVVKEDGAWKIDMSPPGAGGRTPRGGRR